MGVNRGNHHTPSRGRAAARQRPPRRGKALALLLTLLIACGALLLGWQPTPVAAGPDDLSVSIAADDEPLIGGPISYTVTIANTAYVSAPENKAYNVTIENTLPVGVSFLSSTPTITPTITLVNGGTQQKLVFENVTDVARNQTVTFKITATLAPGALPGVATPGAVLTDDVTVKASNNPRADATVIAGTATVNSTARPFKLTKSTAQSTNVNQVTGGCSGVGAGRLFNYTLTATNNPISVSTGMQVEDILPYGVDYCGTPGGQPVPTVSYAADGTTKLVYSFSLAAGQVQTLTPQVAIPYTYPLTRPAGPAITNLLAGQLILDDTPFENTARMSGTYASVVYNTGDKKSPVLAKYVTISKSSNKPNVIYNTSPDNIVTYTLTPQTSANYTASNLYLIDTLPNGEDFVGAESLPLSDNAATNGIYTPCNDPGHVAASGIYRCADGTTELTWGPLYTNPLAPLPAANQFSLTFDAIFRPTYRQGTLPPVLAGDSLTNNVRLVYDAGSISPGHDAQPNSVTRHEDHASASHATAVPQLDKTIVSVKRGDRTSGDGGLISATSAVAAVGDIVTFRLAYDASGVATDQKNIVITDFLPDGYAYIGGSTRYSGSYGGTVNTQPLMSNPDPKCYPSCVTSDALIYELTGTGAPLNKIVPQYNTLTIQFEARVVGAFGPRENLGKYTGSSTSGAAYSGRSAAKVNDLAPNLTVAKTNTATNPAFGNNTFAYTVTVTNIGSSTAYQIADLIDTLPADIKHTGDVAIDPPGALTFVSYTGGDAGGFGGTLRYTVNTAIGATAPNNFVRVTYNALIQSAPAVGATRTNTAQIISYNSQPSTSPPGSGGSYGPVSGTSQVHIGGDTLTKIADVIGPRANGASGPITIGDQVRYTLTYSIPANTTLYEGQIRDCMPLGFHYVDLSYKGTVVAGTMQAPDTFARSQTDPGFSANNNGIPAEGCRVDQQLIIIPVGTQINTATGITLKAELTATITGKNRSGTPVFNTYPGPNNTNSNGNPNVNRAFVFAKATAGSPTPTQVATVTKENNGADNNVYIPHLTLNKTVARTSNPATLTYSVPVPPYPLVREGSTVDYLLQLRNDGGSPAHQIAALIDTLDAPLTYLQAYQSGASCDTAIPLGGVTAAGQVVTITPLDPLGAGQSFYVCLRAQVGAGTTLSTLYNNNLQLGSGVGAKYSSAPNLPANYPSRAGYTQDQIAQGIVRTPDLITFGPLPNKTYGDGPTPLAATSSGGRPIDYSVAPGSTCVIIGSAPNFSVRITGAGTCTVIASQRGENLAPDVQQSFTIVKALLTVKVNDLTVPFGAPISSACTLAPNYPQGFVYGETTAVLGGALTCSTAATPGSTGSFPLIPSGYTSNNYTITYLGARVTIVPCQVTLAITMLPAGTIQYSDQLTLRARVTTCGGNVLPTGPVQFLVDGTIIGSSVLDNTGLAQLPYQVFQTAGSPHGITARYASTDSRFYSASAGPAPLTVTQENATVTYKPERYAFAVNNATKRGTVQLMAEVKDISATSSDAFPGDIRTARVRFFNATTGVLINPACDNLPVALISTADTKVGTASCTFQSPAATFNIRIEVFGNYSASYTLTQPVIVGTGSASVGLPTAVGVDLRAARREEG